MALARAFVVASIANPVRLQSDGREGVFYGRGERYSATRYRFSRGQPREGFGVRLIVAESLPYYLRTFGRSLCIATLKSLERTGFV
jgi:hypothetical protein